MRRVRLSMWALIARGPVATRTHTAKLAAPSDAPIHLLSVSIPVHVDLDALAHSSTGPTHLLTIRETRLTCQQNLASRLQPCYHGIAAMLYDYELKTRTHSRASLLQWRGMH
jgi:hypothetical protein